MKIKVSGATGLVLDWMVAKAEGYRAEDLVHLARRVPNKNYGRFLTKYSTDWSQGGPIITNAHISRTIDHSGLWVAYWTDGYGDEAKKWMHCDRSELVAAMRCFVESKLGDEVEVPEELE